MKSNSFTKVLVGQFLIVILMSFCAMGTDFFNSTTVPSSQTYTSVNIHDTPPNHTTVQFYGHSDALTIGNASTLNIYNGATFGIDGLHFSCYSYSSSTVNLYQGGSFRGGISGDLRLYNSSTLNIQGGTVASSFTSYDSSVINLYSGSCDFGFSLTGNSTMNIFGGYVGHFMFNNDLSSTSTLNIYGYGFNYNPHGQSYGDDWWVSKLTGYTLGGTPFTYWGIPDPAVYSNVNLIPEPATMTLLALGGLFLRKRK